MDGFNSAAIKANRAADVLRQALEVEEQWRTTVPLDMTVAVERTAKGFDAVVRLTHVPDVPIRLMLLLDEFFHHARSALDHVIWQLATDGGQALLKNQAFPVHKTETDRAKILNSKKRLVAGTAGLSAEALKIVKSVQPYRAGPDYLSTYLWQLHRLDVVAKHRSVLPAGAYFNQIVFAGDDVQKSGFADGFDHQLPTTVAAEAFAGGVILRTLGVPETYNPPVPSTWLHPDMPRLWVIALHECGAIALQQLPNMLNHVWQIVRELNATRANPVDIG